MHVDREIIRVFLVEFSEGSIEVGYDDSLLESGLLDSLTMVELLGFIEARFEVTIDDDEVIPENFETIERIAGFLERKVAKCIQ